MKTDVLFGAVLAAILVVPPAVSLEAAQSSEEEASSSAETQQENASAASQSSGGQRRDPFRAIVVQKAEAEIPDQLPPGKAGLVIGQLQVQGIARSVDGTWIAVVDNNTNRAYFLREGDKLYNGTVSAISPDRVVFMEETTNARGQNITKEVVKRLPED